MIGREAGPGYADAAAARSRRRGFAGAVLLLVLMATGGFEQRVQARSVGSHIVACDGAAIDRVQLAGELPSAAAERRAASGPASPPRLPHRARRVGTRGLPPARAPTD